MASPGEPQWMKADEGRLKRNCCVSTAVLRRQSERKSDADRVATSHTEEMPTAQNEELLNAA